MNGNNEISCKEFNDSFLVLNQKLQSARTAPKRAQFEPIEYTMASKRCEGNLYAVYGNDLP